MGKDLSIPNHWRPFTHAHTHTPEMLARHSNTLNSVIMDAQANIFSSQQLKTLKVLPSANINVFEQRRRRNRDQAWRAQTKEEKNVIDHFVFSSK